MGARAEGACLLIGGKQGRLGAEDACLVLVGGLLRLTHDWMGPHGTEPSALCQGEWGKGVNRGRAHVSPTGVHLQLRTATAAVV